MPDTQQEPRRIGPIARRALATQSDERLIALLRAGQEPAFEEIVRRYRTSLTAFAAAFIPHHRAEDVVQNSLVKAHKALLANDREVALRAWLFTIVRNGCLNAIRDEPDWTELDPAYDGVPQPPAIAERNDELARLVTAICALPETQRRALVGRELEGHGHAELAAELGTTSTAIRGLILRARTSLRDAIGALIPAPALSLLLGGGGAGAAGAGTGVGVGVGSAGAGAGLTGAKLAAAISSAALVLGGGIALGRRANDNRDPKQAPQAAKERTAEGSASGAAAAAAAPALPSATTQPDAAGGSSRSSPGDSPNSGPGSDDPGASLDASGSSSGSGSSGGSGGSSGPGSGGGSSSGGAGSTDGSSGPGPGGHSGGPGDFDGSSSGPGPGDDGSGGHEGPGDFGDGETLPLPPPSDGNDTSGPGGHSGPGGGDRFGDYDSSGSGSGGHSGPGA